MFRNRLSSTSVKHLAFIAALGGFLITSSVQAVIVTEAHVCSADSDTGGSWGGGYYFPGARSARTYQYEILSEPLELVVNLTAYPEVGYNYTQVNGYAHSPTGVWYNEADAVLIDPDTAPGYLSSNHLAWTPTVTRAISSHFIPRSAPLEDNGCKNEVSFL